MPHRVGDEIELTIEKRNIKPTPGGAPGKVFYAPESDSMNYGSDYFIFDAAAYIAKFGGPTNGGTAKVRIEVANPGRLLRVEPKAGDAVPRVLAAKPIAC